ncbi:MAG: SufS family cysteine desulfurase [Bacteroidales bacterium]|nr:SufS family cysteine desulfurase [Bacteroidales bacterium]
MKSVQEIRDRFPALSKKVYGKPLVYFDNAATSQKPQEVIDFQTEMSSFENANIHRAVHKLSAEATDLYEQGRLAVQQFINAPGTENIIFTSGATAAANLVASSFGHAFLKSGDKVLVSESEHHSNIVPWQFVCEATGAELVVVRVNENGEVTPQAVAELLDESVKFVSVTHVSNVLGVVNDVKAIVDEVHSKGIPVMVDGAQGIVHTDVDVQNIGCDFYYFSGHKIYGPTGTGILYGKREMLEKLPPYMGGGDMVGSVSFEKTTYADLPLKFEAGTPNFIGAACYAKSLAFASQLKESAFVKEHEKRLMSLMDKGLMEIDGLNMPSSGSKNRTPVYSFTIEGVHPTDLAMLLDKMGIAVRSGLMCAEPLVKKYSDKGMLRASLLPYNTEEEAVYFIESLKRAVNMLR